MGKTEWADDIKMELNLSDRRQKDNYQRRRPSVHFFRDGGALHQSTKITY